MENLPFVQLTTSRRGDVWTYLHLSICHREAVGYAGRGTGQFDFLPIVEMSTGWDRVAVIAAASKQTTRRVERTGQIDTDSFLAA